MFQRVSINIVQNYLQKLLFYTPPHVRSQFIKTKSIIEQIMTNSKHISWQTAGEK
jgi:hypothetical protein